MFKKILIIALLGIIFSTAAHGITFKEFFQEPLPNVVEFAEKAIDWLAWLWSKIIFYAVIIVNWTLDSFLIYFWKATVWLWNLIKTGFLTGWQMIDAVARGLATGSDINWGSIQWPWE